MTRGAEIHWSRFISAQLNERKEERVSRVGSPLNSPETAEGPDL